MVNIENHIFQKLLVEGMVDKIIIRHESDEMEHEDVDYDRHLTDTTPQ